MNLENKLVIFKAQKQIWKVLSNQKIPIKIIWDKKILIKIQITSIKWILKIFIKFTWNSINSFCKNKKLFIELNANSLIYFFFVFLL